jgi:hypothetical protein
MMRDHAVAAGLVLVGGAGNFRMPSPIPYQHQSPKDVPSVISVAGVAALTLSAAPTMPAWRVEAILERTARDLGPTGQDNDFGAGLPGALAAVRMARGSTRAFD